MQAPIAALLLCLLPAPVLAELAVIAHPGNLLGALTPKEAQDIFLGRARVFPDHGPVAPIDQDSPLRDDFYRKLTGRGVEQIDAYWARIMFTGQASPPSRLPDDAAVLRKVRESEDAIGYIDNTHTDGTVRVLLRLP